MNPLWLLLVVFLLAISAFLSLSEMALVGLSKLRLRHLVDQGVKHAQALQRLVQNLDEAITSLVLANNFINTAISSIGAGLCITWVGLEWGIPLATFLVGSVILLFGEVTPKVFAIRHAERVALGVAPAVGFFLRVLGPVSRRFTALSGLLLRMFGVPSKTRSPLVTEEELKLLIEVGKEEGVLGEHERMMLHRIFEFGDLKVSDVMVPREKMVAVSEVASHDEVLTIFTEQGHSRIPVYRDNPAKIIGVIYAQEILHIWREEWLIVLQDLLHPPFEVPPQRRVSEVLQEFQRRRIQIAIVVDAQGQALGMLTLEDLIEEIVGELDEGISLPPLA